MKTIRNAILIVFCIAMSTLLFGCAKKADTIQIDVNGLCDTLLAGASFEDELSPVDDAMIKKLYDIENYVSAKAYLSSGATAEEVAVFEFGSEDEAAEGVEKVQTRIEEQKSDFESYVPKEIPKLDAAVVQQYGKYVVVCISNGGEAEKIITEYVSAQNGE